MRHAETGFLSRVSHEMCDSLCQKPAVTGFSNAASIGTALAIKSTGIVH